MSAKGRDTESSRMIHIRLAPEDHRRLRILVAGRDTTIQDWVQAVVLKELERQESKVKR